MSIDAAQSEREALILCRTATKHADCVPSKNRGPVPYECSYYVLLGHGDVAKGSDVCYTSDVQMSVACFRSGSYQSQRHDSSGTRVISVDDMISCPAGASESQGE